MVVRSHSMLAALLLLVFCQAGSATPLAATPLAATPPSAPSFRSGAPGGLPALLARALVRDPQVAAAQAALATTEARYRQARSRLLPNAGLQATKGRSSDLDGIFPVQRETRQVEASLRMNLYNGGADRAEMQAAEREIGAAETDVRRAKEEAAERLAEAYFDVQRLDRTLSLSAARLAEVQQLVRQVARQTELGKSSELDLQQAQNAQLDAELTEDSLQAERAAAQIKLATLASEAVNDFADFSFGPQPDAIVGADSELQAQVRAAQDRAEAAKLRVRSLANTLAPKVDVDLRKLLSNHTTPPPSTLQQHGWSIGISWDFPLGGETLARRDESVSRAAAAEADAMRARQGARAELDSLVPRIANGERSVALLDQQVLKMAALVRGGAIQYEAGRRNLQQIIQTRDNYFMVQQRRVEQGHKLMLAQMRQLALSGRLLRAFGLAAG